MAALQGLQDLVPRLDIDPLPPAVEAWSPNHWTAEERSQKCVFKEQNPKQNEHPSTPTPAARKAMQIGRSWWAWWLLSRTGDKQRGESCMGPLPRVLSYVYDPKAVSVNQYKRHSPHSPATSSLEAR